jgi:hypothetical protein
MVLTATLAASHNGPSCLLEAYRREEPARA